ncbi:MAG: pantetheine-phosphate adenylyltransferase [bacterium]
MAWTIAVYPGTFDPVTNGHLDIIERGLRLFDQLIVAVVARPSKSTFFTLEERMDMVRGAVQELDVRKTNSKLQLESFEILLIDYVRQKNAHVILRGLRALSDFEYEFELALTNRRMASDIETVFLAPSQEHVFLRATLVKEVARHGGDVSSFVPEYVQRRLMEKIQSLPAVR